MAPTADEYASPAETVALALKVEAEVTRLREENAELQAEVTRLTEQVQTLTTQAAAPRRGTQRR